MHNMFFYLLLGVISIGSLHAETLALSDTKALTATSLLKTADDKVLSVITLPTVYDDKGRVAKGTQKIDFTLSENAEFGVNVGGSDVEPGESVQFNFQANDLGGLDIPLYSNSLGIVGASEFSLYINEVKVISCPSGYALSSSESYCYKQTYKDISSYSCNGQSGFNYYTASGNSKGSEGETCYAQLNHIVTLDQSFSCPSGYTRGKWVSDMCTDSHAYVTSNKEVCEASGGDYSWSGQNTVCTYISPIHISIPKIYTCPGFKSENRCLDSGNIGKATVVNCPSGYDYIGGNKCTKTFTVPTQ